MTQAIVDTKSLSPLTETADAILALINSKPRSPTREELIAVLEELQPAGHCHSDQVLQWRALLAAENAAWAALDAVDRGDPEHAAKVTEATAASDAVALFVNAQWDRRVTSWADVIVAAEIAMHWCWPEDDPEATEDFHQVIADRSRIGFDTRAPAHLIRSVRAMAEQSGKVPPLPLLRSIEELVEAFGGAEAVGKLLGIREAAVTDWSRRGFIPPGWHYRLHIEARRRGFVVDPAGVFGLTEDSHA